MPGIFISYSRETISAAKTLADDIEKLGYATWLDQDLSGGKAWWDQILAQILDCEIFVLALSPESVTSIACTRESSYAEDLGKPILPIMVAEGVGVLPARLSKIHYVDYRKQDRDALADLARALKRTPPAAALPQPLPEPPAIPLSYLGRIAEQVDADTPLSSKDQSEIVSELRGGLNDPETAAGARDLLVRLSRRHDLLARIGKEIDALLQVAPPPGDRLPPPPPEVLSRLPREAPPPLPDEVPSLPGADTGSSSRRARLVPALLGAAIGGVLGLVALAIEEKVSIYAMSPAVAGAIAGAISQKDIRVIAVAFAGAMLGLVAAFSIIGRPDVQPLFALIIFMPLGAVIGAILGAIIRKRQNWP